MRAVFGLVLLIGMGLAGFAVYTVKGHFDQQERRLIQERQRAAEIVKTIDIYSPTRALTYGDLLTAEDVQLIKYAEDYLPEGVFKTEEELFPEGLDTPRVVTLPMQVNEPITATKVTEPGAPRGITALLEPGMRAYPLPASVTQAFVEELRPTDRIDIYWSGRLGDKQTTSIILTGIEIISVDADANRRGTGVVLQVTPEEFAALAAAQNAGSLSLTPVGTGDDTVVSDIQTNIADVLGIEEIIVEEEPEEVVVEDKRCFVTRRVGTERTQEEIPCTD